MFINVNQTKEKGAYWSHKLVMSKTSTFWNMLLESPNMTPHSELPIYVNMYSIIVND